MYHLLVSADETAWAGSSCTFDIGRAIREYTDESIKSRFLALDSTTIAELQHFPALFATEIGPRATARIGAITGIISGDRDYPVQYN